MSGERISPLKTPMEQNKGGQPYDLSRFNNAGQEMGFQNSELPLAGHESRRELQVESKTWQGCQQHHQGNSFLILEVLLNQQCS
jgi:hypothetical protein